MRFEDFFHAVYKALEQSYLLSEVELVKDYSNLCLILKPSKIIDESLTETLTQWRKDADTVGEDNADVNNHVTVLANSISHGTLASIPIAKTSTMKYEESIQFKFPVEIIQF